MTEFNKDHYRTPRYVFRWLEHRFYWFHLDGCANEAHALRPRWIGPSSKICEDFLSEELFDRLLDEVVEQADMFIFGHTPVRDPLKLGNRFYIDTGAVFNGNLTLVKLD
ncbi:hypothetical protein [Rodentibacter pneumotropicus]|uniref:hypothetical protein n=1 Tax=Rodentibacter pneumotropicus TaxID=758 RepID=UPI00109D5225|nr:hypothetical protein [Rodentibacter pneumotropicus]THA09403.1 hypothetical protein D3M77_01985 [Rodentibacter pneumotropicus]